MRSFHGLPTQGDFSSFSRSSSFSGYPLFGMKKLIQSFGLKHIVMLIAFQHIMQGFMYNMTYPCTRWVLAIFKLPAPRFQVLSGIVDLCWALKLPIGVISDAHPIRGYRKRPYLLMALTVGFLGIVALGFVPPARIGLTSTVVFLCLVQIMLTACDLISLSTYAQKAKGIPEESSNLTCFMWQGMSFGQLVASCILGPLIATYGVGSAFLVAGIPIALLVNVVSRDYFEEEKTINAFSQKTDKSDARKAYGLCILILSSIVGLSIGGVVVGDVAVNALASILMSVAVLVATTIVLHPTIARVNAFFLLQSAMTPCIRGAAFYFYTDTDEMYPDGPHFSETFFVSFIGVLSTLFGMLGVYFSQTYSLGMSYQCLLFYTNVAYSLLCMLEAVMFSRLNQRLGIPDELFIMGSTMFATVVMQWRLLPETIIMAHVCPEGKEATILSLLAGCTYMGHTVGANTGAWMLEALKIEPSGSLLEGEQFENLWIASVVASVLPLVALVLLPHLIPNAMIGDGPLAPGCMWRHSVGEVAGLGCELAPSSSLSRTSGSR